MNASLFLLCPTDCLEFIINKEFEGKNYFYSSLGNTSTFDSITLEAIKGLIDKHHIREIYFVLSMRNKIVSDAMGGQTFPQTRMLQNFTKEIGLHKKQSKLFWNTTDEVFSTVSYYLNQKIIQLQQNLRSELYQYVNIKGKVYMKSENTFVDIYPDLVCLTKHNLN